MKNGGVKDEVILAAEELGEKLINEDEPGDDEQMATFIADHPFLFFLVFEEGEPNSNMVVLLAGRYSGP